MGSPSCEASSSRRNRASRELVFSFWGLPLDSCCVCAAVLQLPPHPTVQALTSFHSDDYIAFLRSTAEPYPEAFGSHLVASGSRSPEFRSPGATSSPPAFTAAASSPYSFQGLPVTAASVSQGTPHSPGSLGPCGSQSEGTVAGSPGFVEQINKFNLGEDCPVFDGLWEYCKTYTGGSIEGARRVARGDYQFAINWWALRTSPLHASEQF